MNPQGSGSALCHQQADVERNIPEEILLRLKPRERAVLVEFVNEPCAKRIAERLRLSHSTVSNYLTSIRQHLGASTPAALMKLVLTGNEPAHPSTESGKIPTQNSLRVD